MIKQISFYGLIALLTMFCACGSSDDTTTVQEGNWVKRSSFDGVARSGAVTFVVGTKAFVGLGYDGDEYLTDFWSYDADQNFWQRVADFPGVGRTGGVAFAIDGKGYVGTGYDGEAKDEVMDFWEYDVAADTWTQIADFGGTKRLSAVAFAVNGKGYVGTGNDGNYVKDFWEFDPNTGQWAQIVSLKGEKKRNAVAFVIGDNAYVGTGTNNGLYETDFWEFTSSPVDWIQKGSLTAETTYEIQRERAVGFALGGMGYVSTGVFSANLASTWQYDPVEDLWTEVTAFEGTPRQGAVAFTVDGRSFVALGQNSSNRFDDVWEFKPNESYNEND